MATTTYRLPFYCLGWVPLNHIATADDSSPHPMLVLAGGGGEGSSGIHNSIILTQFNPQSLALSENPVHRLNTGSDLPYRMAVHPKGAGVVCSFPESCRFYEWEVAADGDFGKLEMRLSDKEMGKLEGVGQQLALGFSGDGTMLATGGEDGHLRVFKWPEMEVILDNADAHSTVKDLDFSCDGKFLVSLGSSGPCRVWDLTTLAIAASLPRENGEVFRYCRFSQSASNNQILYVATMHGDHGRIASWDSLSWKRIRTSKIVRDSISSLSVSMDGTFLAVGTPNGDVVIVTSNMQEYKVIKKAHLGIVTAVEFSQDSRALVSASMDSTARVTLLDGGKEHGSRLSHFLLLVLLAILLYFLLQKNVQDRILLILNSYRGSSGSM